MGKKTNKGIRKRVKIRGFQVENPGVGTDVGRVLQKGPKIITSEEKRGEDSSDDRKQINVKIRRDRKSLSTIAFSASRFLSPPDFVLMGPFRDVQVVQEGRVSQVPSPSKK
ncbi:hypothetical protein RUM43_009245 [Polyplax serrata]|uniref:Uncharacterized protein n=1 Tax=Polyplax serrata TaxID=468196 RepID=A0AAN8PHZ6_POLSC